MDYQEIIMNGYFEDRETLDEYFIEKYREANLKFQGKNRFFRGLNKVIENWEQQLEEKVNNRKTELFDYRNKVMNGTAKVSATEGKTIEETKNDILSVWKSELEKISKDHYSVDLHYNGNYYPIPYFEVQLIKESIEKAFSFDVGFTDLSTKSIEPPGTLNKNDLGFKRIQFDSLETKSKFYSELKGFFPGKEDELLKALNGENLDEKLLFPANQNKFVEVIRRLIYNNKIVNNYTEAKDWICINFQFNYKRGKVDEARNFNPMTVYDGLKGKGNPSKGKRILESDWLPYHSIDKLREFNK